MKKKIVKKANTNLMQDLIKDHAIGVQNVYNEFKKIKSIIFKDNEERSIKSHESIHSRVSKLEVTLDYLIERSNDLEVVNRHLILKIDKLTELVNPKKISKKINKK